MKKMLIIALLAATAISAGAVERKVKKDDFWEDFQIVEFTDSDQLAIVFAVVYIHEYRTFSRTNQVMLYLAGFPELIMDYPGHFSLMDSIAADKRPTAVEFRLDDRGGRSLWEIRFDEIDYGPQDGDRRYFDMCGYGPLELQLCRDSAVLAKVPDGQLVVEMDSAWTNLVYRKAELAPNFQCGYSYPAPANATRFASWRNQVFFLTEEQMLFHSFHYVTLHRAPNGQYHFGYALE